MYRKAEKKIQEWIDHSKKALLIHGARQVGKTTLINQFSEKFDNYLYLNLDRKRDCSLFVEDDIPTLIDRIHIHCRKQKSDGKTLLFIDEIQNSPEAVRLLRYFREEAPSLFVVAAGSLLETLIEIGRRLEADFVTCFIPCRTCRVLGIKAVFIFGVPEWHRRRI